MAEESWIKSYRDATSSDEKFEEASLKDYSLKDQKDLSLKSEAMSAMLEISKGTVHTTAKETVYLSHKDAFFDWTSRFGAGVIDDVYRRAKHYPSDWSDGVHKKLFSATLFLYFACLLPSIAFGALNESSTEGYFSVKKTIVAQAIGGVIFAVFSTQPMVILLSTAPLAIFIKLAYDISLSENIPFTGFYAWIGIFNSIFLLIFGITNISDIFLLYSSPFLCETFGLFISVALATDGIKALVYEFLAKYQEGTRDNALLWLILMYATVTIGSFFLDFRKTKLFSPPVCEVIGDFALPLSVLITSFFGSYVFREVQLVGFNADVDITLTFPDLLIGTKGILIAIPLAFALSILMFIDQSISAALISSSKNKLKKGIYYHSDIILLAVINFILSILGLPWIHGALPHTPMHAIATAETVITEKSNNRRIVRAVESRLAAFSSHICIAITYLMLPIPLKFIPYPVLYGLFLYLAVTALPDNGFYHRIISMIKNPGPLFAVEITEHGEGEGRGGGGNGERGEESKMQSGGRTIGEAIEEGGGTEMRESGGMGDARSNRIILALENEEIEGDTGVMGNIENAGHNVGYGGDKDELFVSSKIRKRSSPVDVEEIPVKTILVYTFIQFICLSFLCICGLYPQPYLNLIFPILLSFLIPFKIYCLSPYFGVQLEVIDRDGNDMCESNKD